MIVFNISCSQTVLPIYKILSLKIVWIRVTVLLMVLDVLIGFDCIEVESLN